jgi:transcriptional regulator with XRE-family HTH domain
MTTAQRIREGRKRLGMTEQQFADAIGVSRGAVQQWERGTTLPKRGHQIALARKLGTSVVDLMDLTDATIAETPISHDHSQVKAPATAPFFASEPAAGYNARSPADEAAALVRAMSPAGQAEALAYLRFMAARHSGATGR